MKLFESLMKTKLMENVAKRLQEYTGIPDMGQVDDDDYLYRNITDGQAKRDLSPITQTRMQQIAMHQYEATPMGKRLMEMHKDFVIGEGIKYRAKDPEVQKVLDIFWHDPINNMDITQYDKALQLALFGEQFYPVWVNPHNGQVFLGYVDPTSVKCVTRNPLNPVILMNVVTNRPIQPFTHNDAHQQRAFKIIDIDRDFNSDTFGKLKGEIFYFAVNKMTNGTRGRSDLLPLSDWIDMHERFLFNIAERARLLSTFIWDVTFEGKSQAGIDDYVKKYGLKVPKPASVRYHNEKMKWNAVAPKLESSDNSEHARILKNQIATGAGIPPFWIGDGEKVTRATALEMSSPSFKHFKTRQFYFKYIIKQMFDFVIDQAVVAGTLKEDVDKSYTINMQPLAEKDFAKTATAMAQISTALSVAVDNGWINDEQAKDFFSHVSGQTGVEINIDESVKFEDYTPDMLKKLKEELKNAKHSRETKENG